jgi:hypothetical protein
MASTVDGVIVPVAQPVVTTLGSGGAAAAKWPDCWCIPP